MSSEELQEIIDAALYGNGELEADDLFWLMLWADWAVEQEMIRERQQAESHGSNCEVALPFTVSAEQRKASA